MGTSSYSKGPKRNSPLLPPWADDFGDDAPPMPQNRPEQTNEGSPPKDRQGDDEQTDPQTSEPRQPTIDYSSTRRQVRHYAAGSGSGGGMRRLVHSFVSGSKGARNATRTSTAGRRATAGIARFAHDIATQGVEQALERLQLGDIVGQSVNAVLNRVTDALLLNAASVDDREAARSSTFRTLSVMYERYSQDGGDITDLNALNIESVGEFVLISMSNYIYERVMLVAEHTFEGNGMPQERLFAMEQELTGFIQADVNREFKDMNIASIDWSTSETDRLVTQLYERAYEIWEALQV